MGGSESRPSAISINCYALWPSGKANSVLIEFRPLPQAFSVWTAMDHDPGDEPEWFEEGTQPGPLTWRTATQYLQSNDGLRVSGGLMSFHVDGVPAGASEVMFCFFWDCELASFDYRSIGRLLLGFTDSEVDRIVGDVGPISLQFEARHVPPELLALEAIAERVEDIGWLGRTLLQITTDLGLSAASSLEEVAAGLERGRTGDSR